MRPSWTAATTSRMASETSTGLWSIAGRRSRTPSRSVIPVVLGRSDAHVCTPPLSLAAPRVGGMGAVRSSEVERARSTLVVLDERLKHRAMLCSPFIDDELPTVGLSVDTVDDRQRGFQCSSQCLIAVTQRRVRSLQLGDFVDAHLLCHSSRGPGRGECDRAQHDCPFIPPALHCPPRDDRATDSRVGRQPTSRRPPTATRAGARTRVPDPANCPRQTHP